MRLLRIFLLLCFLAALLWGVKGTAEYAADHTPSFVKAPADADSMTKHIPR